MPDPMTAMTADTTAPRWTYACTRCDWRGDDPTEVFCAGIGRTCDCPECGNSCTSDEPEFEPEREDG